MSTGDTPPSGWQPDQPPYGPPQYGQAQPPSYGQPQYGQPQPGQPQYGQPQYGQPQYGQPAYGQPRYGPQYGQPGFGAGGPPPNRSRATWAWLAGGAVVVVAAIVVIVVVLTSGGGGSGHPVAAGNTDGTRTRSTAPTGFGTGPATTAPTSTAPTTPTPAATTPTATASGASASVPAGAPTTDKLPHNTGSDSCTTDGYPDLVAVSVTTVLHLTPHGTTPNSFVQDVLRDCTSAKVRSRISSLFGQNFGYRTGDDLTGADGEGATAQYRMHDKSGGSILLTLTRQQDGHYEVTAYTFQR